MDAGLFRNWWIVALRGLLAVAFGVLTFARPGITLAALVLFFGAYALVDGVFNVAAAVVNRAGGPPWWALLISGVLSLVAAGVAFTRPDLTLVVLRYLIAAWAVASGLSHVAAAFRLRKAIAGEWTLALAGALAVLFGVSLVLYPAGGALAVASWISAFAVVYGLALIALGLRLRGGAGRAG